jgi:hypothetical protein
MATIEKGLKGLVHVVADVFDTVHSTGALLDRMCQAFAEKFDGAKVPEEQENYICDEVARVRQWSAAAAKTRKSELRAIISVYPKLPDAMTALRNSKKNEKPVTFEAGLKLARALKKLAKSEEVHVVALAQLNDDPNKRGKDERKPTSRDFRESKAIPQNADNVVLIYNQAARARAAQVHSGQQPARSTSGVCSTRYRRSCAADCLTTCWSSPRGARTAHRFASTPWPAPAPNRTSSRRSS